MKAPVIALSLTLLALSSSAQASWYQHFCSNAEGTTRSANGHNQNYLQLTKREWTDKGRVETVITDTEHKLRVLPVGEAKVVVSEQKGSCDRANGNTGFWSSRSVTAGSYEISHADGVLFDENIVGVSKDRKTVKVELICERAMNGLMPCPAK